MFGLRSIKNYSSVIVSPSLRIIQQRRESHSLFRLSGIYPPLTTPFHSADESIAFDQLEANLSRYARIPFAGYVVLGSNGEAPFLDRKEKLQIVKVVKEFLLQSGSNNKPLIAGAGCESTKETIRMCEDMARVGADAVMVITPFYFKGQMNDLAMIAHYTAVAEASPIPVILYSVPSNTGIDLSIEAIRVLADHPNIIGIKDSGGNVAKIASLVNKTRRDNGKHFDVVVGSAAFLLPAFTTGAKGAICGLANVLGEAICLLHSKYFENNCLDVELQRKLIGPDFMEDEYGVAGIKAAMDLLGYHGGRNRSPIAPLDEASREAIRRIFIASGFASNSTNKNTYSL